MRDENWVVYLIRCSDNSFYCGISNNFERRLEEHNTGKGAKYTKSRRPVALVGLSPEITKSEALKLEYRIKRASTDKKIDELERIGNQISIAKELQALAEKTNSLGKEVKRTVKVIENSGRYR